MTRTSQAMQTLADKAYAPETASARKSVRQIVEGETAEFAKALPAHIGIDRFMRLATTEFRTNPKLMECTPVSVVSSLMAAAQLGLEPGPLQHCYLIPRYSRKRQALECTFLIGYQGLIELFRRAGVTVFARKVCEKDQFDFYTDELGDHILHRPALNDRGSPICYYSLATLPSGNRVAHVMSLDDIDAHRRRSESADRGPWVTDEEAMSMKTVIRDQARWLPKSIELTDAFAKEYENAPQLIVPPDSRQPTAVGQPEQPAIDAATADYDLIEAHIVEEGDDAWEDPDLANPGEPPEALLGGES